MDTCLTLVLDCILFVFRIVPTGVVDLDLPPNQRWQKLGKQYSQEVIFFYHAGED